MLGHRRRSAIHMAAVTQIRHHSSPGHLNYERKLAVGKTDERLGVPG